MEKAQKIADSLSDAQKRLLLSLGKAAFLDLRVPSINIRTRDILISMGLTEEVDSYGACSYFIRRLSPLGKEVKAILEKQL